MRHKGARLIEAGELYAILILPELIKKRGSNLLGRRALCIAGKAAVNIHILRRPESRAGIHGKTDCRRHDHHALARHDAAVALHLAQERNQTRADIELLHLVAAQRAQHDAALLALAEAIAHDVHVAAEIRRHGKDHVFFHGHSFLHRRAISVPG